jgi:hypothetical protein
LKVELAENAIPADCENPIISVFAMGNAKEAIDITSDD